MQIPTEYVTLKNQKRAKITSCHARDAQKMVDYLSELAKTTDYMIRYPEEAVYDLQEEQEFLAKTLKSEQNFFVTCFVDEEIVGNLGVYAVGNVQKLKHRAQIGIGVKEEYRNCHVGSILLEHAISFARQMGYEQLELDVVSENEAALALYQKYGFVKIGTIPRGIKRKDGGYYDLDFMVMKL